MHFFGVYRVDFKQKIPFKAGMEERFNSAKGTTHVNIPGDFDFRQT